MANVEYLFIGWFRNEAKNSDKVWGLIKISDNSCVAFWGRRGKKLQTKIHNFEYINSAYLPSEIERLLNSKTSKGYIRVNKDKLDKVYPEFQQDLEQTAVWSILTNSYGKTK